MWPHAPPEPPNRWQIPRNAHLRDFWQEVAASTAPVRSSAMQCLREPRGASRSTRFAAGRHHVEMNEVPIRPDELGDQRTPVDPQSADPLRPEPRDRPGPRGALASAPVWIIVGVAFLVALFVLLLVWPLFGVR